MNWLEVWERKGKEETTDLVKLDGFENTKIDPAIVADRICSALSISKGDRVLEVGCGAGMLAQFLDCQYVGVDYSPAMITKFISLQHKSALVCSADDLIFKDKSFDKVFAYSVFQYFPNKDYAMKAVSEMLRVAREAVFIGDLPESSHSSDHFLYRRKDFEGWEITPGFYNPVRFNICQRSLS